ncbi:MAG: UbiA family prenyltransferase [Pirellulales bacterium]
MSRPSPLLAYLQLFRLPNVFTAAADVLMGYLIAQRSFSPGGPLALLLAASCLMYVAGMVLNDVFDVEQDTRERPRRPIPSGLIHAGFALTLGRAMLAGGALCGWAATLATGDVRCGVVATALALFVYLYDRVLKRTPFGPLGMGACRLLNVLLGMSTATVAWQTPHFAAAGGIGLYIVGVTWFARTEAVDSRRWQLLLATVVMLLGFVPLAALPRLETEAVVWKFTIAPDRWYLFWGLIAALVGWRCLRAVIQPSPRLVQSAVKHAIMTLIVLDAAAAFPAGGLLTLAILALVFPMLALGSWVYST